MATRSPSAFIDFEIVGNRRGVQGMLEHLDSALSPSGLATFLGLAAGPWIKERAADRFASEGDDATGKWAPLQEATIDIREKSGFEGSHPINKRTGELEEYITQGQVGITSVPAVSTLTYPKNSPSTKSLREKMSTAQRGRSNPTTVPRPVLALGERDLAQVVTMLAFHVQSMGVSSARR